jgi:cellulose biosynthesis protein BcsQ
MSVVAVYNMKGGVGKTTAAVNLAYLAASQGRRVLLWDLDPQAAASFAFRVRPRIDGFGKQSLEDGHAFSDAIKETDFANLHLLPADFAYRKLDRLLDQIGKPKRVVRSLVETIGRDYEVVFLDCPAGFSLVTEGIFAAADAILAPTVPTVLSLRTLVRLMKWADRSESTAGLSAFLSMVGRRKTLHRRACDLARHYPEIFLAGLVPYASIVEQMSVRRLPLPAFAPRDAATAAFGEIWMEFHSGLTRTQQNDEVTEDRWAVRRRAVESLLTQLESADGPNGIAAAHCAEVIELRDHSRGRTPRADHGAAPVDSTVVVHRFDTEGRDLERRGHSLELHERQGTWRLVTSGAHAQIDRSWAFEILSGTLSPLAALERRIGPAGSPGFDTVRTLVDGRILQRIESRLGEADRLSVHPRHASVEPARDAARVKAI